MNVKSLLKNLHISTSIEGLCAITSMTYHFENSTTEDLELLYRVPLPTHTVFQSLVIELNGEEYSASIYAPEEATKRYEEAIEKDDTPVMLEKQEPGIYHLQCGRLRPNDSIKITLKLAELLLPSGDQVRYFLPTVIAPLFGNEQANEWSQHVNDFFVEYSYSMELSVTGPLQESRISVIGVNQQSSERMNDRSLFSFSGALDRDILVLFNDIPDLSGTVPAGTDTWQGNCRISQRESLSKRQNARNIVAVLDCSGSMNGVSIKQARLALMQIMSELSPEDTIQILRFGTYNEWVQEKPISPKDRREYSLLKESIQQIAADMGGTQLFEALTEALEKQNSGSKASAILLISDGQAYASRDTIRSFEDEIIQRETALSIVGVGTASNFQMIESACVNSGGISMQISPWEPMSQRIAQLCSRIGYPTLPSLISPQSYASISARYESEYDVEFFEESQKIETNRSEFEKAFASIALMTRYNSSPSRAFAIEHNLLTKHTALLAVAERDSRTNIQDPVVTKVPQMIPEGISSAPAAFPTSIDRSIDTPSWSRQTSSNSFDASLDTPAYFRRPSSLEESSFSDSSMFTETPAFLRENMQDDSIPLNHKKTKEMRAADSRDKENSDVIRSISEEIHVQISFTFDDIPGVIQRELRRSDRFKIAIEKYLETLKPLDSEELLQCDFDWTLSCNRDVMKVLADEWLLSVHDFYQCCYLVYAQEKLINSPYFINRLRLLLGE